RFARISTEICASTYPTISLVYLMYNHLMDHAEKIMKDEKSSKFLVAAAKMA
ncbi:17505_t:CDS:1, partial [Funneliformis geosporum]